MNRRGFALLTVLWLISTLSILAMTATLTARDGTAAASNRIAHARAAWRAEGCAEWARAELDRRIAAGTAWAALGDREGLKVLSRPGCTATLAPAGYGVDVNQASEQRLSRLFRASGVRQAVADSVAQAVLDWRDPDDLPRLIGAERSWYQARGRVVPRNGPFADAAELRLVRGFDGIGVGDSLLSTEPGRTPVNLAPLVLIAALPGVGPEIVTQLRQRRVLGHSLMELAQLAEGVPAYARDSLLARFPELSEVATVEPEAWILTVSAREGSPPIAVTLQLRLVAAAGRAAIVRRRTW